MRYQPAHGEARIKDLVRVIEAVKASTPCADCGRKFPAECMDYDHVRGTKVAGIAAMVRGQYSMEQIALEIEKCEIVCANCHRTRTKNRAARAA